MKNNLTELVFLLDASGSMSNMGREPVDGFNNFIKEQSDPSLGDATVTLCVFASEFSYVYDNVDIKNVKPLVYGKDYIASGMTVLRDAICTTIDKIGDRLSKTKEEDRPSKILFAVLTDGEDTASKKYKADDVTSKISHQTDVYNWEFVFMGTTQEAMNSNVVRSFSLSGSAVANYVGVQNAVGTAYADFSNLATTSRLSTKN